MSFLRTAAKIKPKSSGDRYKLPDDKKDHPIRIVPFSACGAWSFKVLQHWCPDPSGETTFDKSFICRQDQPKAHSLKEGEDELPTFGLECAFEVRAETVTAEIEQLSGKGDEASKNRLKYLRSLEWALRAQESIFLQVLDREDPGQLKEFWAQPKCYEAILNAYMDFAVETTGVADRDALMELSDEELPDLFDIARGHDVLLRKTPKSSGNGFIFHASISPKTTPLASTPAEVKLLKSQVKDPVELVKKMIIDQEADIDAAVEALEKKVKLKANSAKPIKGAEVSDDELFNGKGKGKDKGKPRDADDELPHLEPVNHGGGKRKVAESPSFTGDDGGGGMEDEGGEVDVDEHEFTQRAAPPAKKRSKLAGELAGLDED